MQSDKFTINTRVGQRMDRGGGNLSRTSVIPLHPPWTSPLRKHQSETEEARKERNRESQQVTRERQAEQRQLLSTGD
jgi:hypothetical protein